MNAVTFCVYKNSFKLICWHYWAPALHVPLSVVVKEWYITATCLFFKRVQEEGQKASGLKRVELES